MVCVLVVVVVSCAELLGEDALPAAGDDLLAWRPLSTRGPAGGGVPTSTTLKGRSVIGRNSQYALDQPSRTQKRGMLIAILDKPLVSFLQLGLDDHSIARKTFFPRYEFDDDFQDSNRTKGSLVNFNLQSQLIRPKSRPGSSVRRYSMACDGLGIEVK